MTQIIIKHNFQSNRHATSHTVMSTARGTLVPCSVPLLHVLEVTAMATHLTPHKQPTHGPVAERDRRKGGEDMQHMYMYNMDHVRGLRLLTTRTFVWLDSLYIPVYKHFRNGGSFVTLVHTYVCTSYILYCTCKYMCMYTSLLTRQSTSWLVCHICGTASLHSPCSCCSSCTLCGTWWTPSGENTCGSNSTVNVVPWHLTQREE